jgi:hypothetical protein
MLHRTKFSRHGDLVSGTCVLLFYEFYMFANYLLTEMGFLFSECFTSLSCGVTDFQNC